MIQLHDRYWFVPDLPFLSQVIHHITLCEFWIAITTTVVRAARATRPIDHSEERFFVFGRILRYSYQVGFNIPIGTNAKEPRCCRVGVPKHISTGEPLPTVLFSDKHFRVFRLYVKQK
jgi:hypothetical protein